MRKIIKGLSKAAFAVAFTFVIMGVSNTTAKATQASFDVRVVKTQNAHKYTYSNGKFKDTGKTVAISTVLKAPSAKNGYYTGKDLSSGNNLGYYVKAADCTDIVKLRDLRDLKNNVSPKSARACSVYYIPTTKGNYTKKNISANYSLGINYEATNHDGKIFYLTEKGSYIEDANLDTASRVVFYARKFLGNPYVFGGTSLTNGCDCSGFTMQIYAHFGYSLNRASYQQVNNGTAVSLGSVKPGDLVFYKNGGTQISHVALYIGNGEIIHASTEKTGIIRASMYQSTPCAARRII